MLLAMQSKRNVRVDNFFLLRVRGAANSCARMTLASLSDKHGELLLLQVHWVIIKNK